MANKSGGQGCPNLKHGVNLSRRACRTPRTQSSREPAPETQLFGVLIVLACITQAIALPTFEPPGAQALSLGSSNTAAAAPAQVPLQSGLNSVRSEETTPTVTTSSPSIHPVVHDNHGGHPHNGGHVKRIEIFNVEFHRVEIPMIIGLWIFFASLAKIGFHMTPKLSKIFPESCLLIVVGVIIGIILHNMDSVHLSPMTPNTFFIYMLPPIILDAGYFMPNRLFFDHLGTILLFAVVGTIFNTVTIGLSLWACGMSGLFGVETPILQIFLFSALISAVDPVAVLAVFEEIHVNEILYIVVFGESLLNDAVTVVLYHMFEAYTEMGTANILYTDVLSGLTSFLVVAVGGTIIGVIWGFATGLVTRFTDQVRVIEPIFIFVMAYLAYLTAEIFHMSGILAITFCGITMKNYVEANISHKSHTTIKYTMKMLSSSSETIIFMFLGVSTVNNAHDWNTWFVILTIVFCSFYRILGVIILTALANRFRLHKLDKVEKFVMSYGGLRGAVAFALVLLISKDIVPLKPMFVTTTIAVIYFTVFFQGITIKPLVRILNVKRAEKRKPTMNERIHERFMDHMMAGIEDIIGKHGNYHIRDRFKRFDNKFIRPFIVRNYQGAEPKILETYSKLAMKDAIEYMQRNASTIGNISGTESMSAIFRNYTANFNGSPSFSQLDNNATWNIDMQELEYNPTKKDMTDAKIHHLLAEELCKPYRRLSTYDNSTSKHRRLSYSRHAVDDRDLSTQVNYKTHMNIRRLVGDRKHHHKRSKRLNKDGKQNHVSFPEFQQNGSAKQFTHDYMEEALQEVEAEEQEMKPTGRSDDDGGIMFTAKTTCYIEDISPTSSHKENTRSLINQIANLPGFNPLKARLVKQYSKASFEDILPTAVEKSLPWRRDRSSYNFVPQEDILEEEERRASKSYEERYSGSDPTRVSTPTATETMLPWKREDEGVGALKQSEFPSWASNKEYLAYNSPSATFLDEADTCVAPARRQSTTKLRRDSGIAQPKQAKSIIGLFRRESSSSAGGPSNTAAPSDSEGSLHTEISAHASSSHSRTPHVSGRSYSIAGSNVVLMEEMGHADPLGVSFRPANIMQGPHRGQTRRGSMLELTGISSLTRDPIMEENVSKSLPESERMRRNTISRINPATRPVVKRQHTTIGTSLLSSSSSSSSSDDEKD